MADDKRLKIKDENICLYWVDIDDKIKDVPPEMEEKNQKFEQEVMMPALYQKLKICECRMPKIIERAQRRAALLAQPMPQQGLPVEQEDIDSVQAGVILGAEHGEFKKIRMIATCCKDCGETHMWGELEPFMRMMAVAYNNYTNNPSEDDGITVVESGPTPDPDGPEFVVEDLDTGEMKSADSLVEALTGGSGSKEEFKLTEAEPSKPTHKIIELDDVVGVKDFIDKL